MRISDWSSDVCSSDLQFIPATIIAPGVSGVFLSPGATTTVPNIQANAPCNNSVYANLLPSQFRANAMIKVTNDFSDKFTVTAMMNYNRQETHNASGPGGLTTPPPSAPDRAGAARSTPSTRPPPPRPPRRNAGWGKR